MSILKRYEKLFPYVSGAAFSLYAILGFFGGVDLIWAIFYAAILALGVGCFLHKRIEKSEIIGITALGVIALIVIYTVLLELVAIFEILFTSRLGLFMKLQLILSLIPGFIHAAAWVVTFIYSVIMQTKRSSLFEKYWLVPSAAFVLSALSGLAVNVFIMLINLSLSPGLLFMIFKELLLYALIAVAVLLYAYMQKADNAN